MQSVKNSFTLCLLLSLLLMITACSADDASPRHERIRVMEVTRSIFYAPQYVAIHKGFYEKEGIQIELSNGFGGDKTMTALLSGDADVVLVGAETGIYVSSRGAQNPIIGFAQVTQTDGTFLVSRKPTKNFQWKELKGKKLLGQRKGGMPGNGERTCTTEKTASYLTKRSRSSKISILKTWAALLFREREITPNSSNRSPPRSNRKERDMWLLPSDWTAEGCPTPLPCERELPQGESGADGTIHPCPLQSSTLGEKPFPGGNRQCHSALIQGYRPGDSDQSDPTLSVGRKPGPQTRSLTGRSTTICFK